MTTIEPGLHPVRDLEEAVFEDDLIDFWQRARQRGRYLTRVDAPYVFTFFEEGSVAALSHYDDVRYVLRDNDHFVNRSNLSPRRLPPEDYDPPEHGRYRKLLDPYFSPRAVLRLRPAMEEIARGLIDKIRDRGECDFVTDFAIPYPSAIFLILMGVPPEQLPRFLDLKDRIVRPSGDTPELQQAAHAQASAELYAYYESFMVFRRENPSDDLFSQLLTGVIDDERLTDDEILDIAFLLTIAGLDTVTSALSCDLLYLVNHPEHRDLLVTDPDIIPSAVEELLRWESPVYILRRLAIQPTEVGGGCPVDAGQKATVSIISANHDEAQFPDAATVDLRRTPNRHLAFAAGIHRCLGSHLARLELVVALEEWHRAFPAYQLPLGVAPHTIDYGVRFVPELPLIVRPDRGAL